MNNENIDVLEDLNDQPKQDNLVIETVSQPEELVIEEVPKQEEVLIEDLPAPETIDNNQPIQDIDVLEEENQQTENNNENSKTAYQAPRIRYIGSRFGLDR